MGVRRILIAAVALVALAGGVWFSNRQEAKTADKPDPEVPPAILEIPVEQIQRVEIASGDKIITLERGENGKYEVTGPERVEADRDTASGVFTLLSAFNSTRLIEEAGDPAGYGLDHPSVAVTVMKKGGGSSKLLIGDEIPTGGAFFAKLDGDPRIFTTSSVNKSGVGKSFEDLRDKHLLPFDRDGLTRIELTSKGAAYEFTKDDQGRWRISKPSEMRADREQLDELINQVENARMNPEGAPVDPSAWLRAAVVGRIRMADGSGARQIEIRKSSDDKYYANSETIEGAHSVNAALAEAVEKGGGEYRARKLFDFGFEELSQIEVKDGGVSRAFIKTDGKWMSNGKEMDSIGVLSLVDKLRNLEATEFVKSGGGQPSIEARVVAEASQRAERVLITPAGERWIARRDNEPAFYVVAADKIKEFQQAAADVKEASPPKKGADAK